MVQRDALSDMLKLTAVTKGPKPHGLIHSFSRRSPSLRRYRHKELPRREAGVDPAV